MNYQSVILILDQIMILLMNDMVQNHQIHHDKLQIQHLLIQMVELILL